MTINESSVDSERSIVETLCEEEPIFIVAQLPFFDTMQRSSRNAHSPCSALRKTATLLLLSIVAVAAPSKEKDATQYGMGLIVNIPFPESEVTQVVRDVIQNGLIRGTKEYNKDEYITGATAATSTHVFPEWTEGGKCFLQGAPEGDRPSKL